MCTLLEKEKDCSSTNSQSEKQGETSHNSVTTDEGETSTSITSLPPSTARTSSREAGSQSVTPNTLRKSAWKKLALLGLEDKSGCNLSLYWIKFQPFSRSSSLPRTSKEDRGQKKNQKHALLLKANEQKNINHSFSAFRAHNDGTCGSNPHRTTLRTVISDGVPSVGHAHVSNALCNRNNHMKLFEV